MAIDVTTLSDAELDVLASGDQTGWAKVAAQKHSVPEYLIDPVINQESGGKQSAVSPKGARGVMQLMPGTAKSLGVNPNDWAENIWGGMQYLGEQLNTFKSPELALAAYNAGPGRVKGGKVPNIKETKNYVKTITDNIDVTKLSDDELDMLASGEISSSISSGITSYTGNSCGNALAKFANAGPLKGTGVSLPKDGIGPGELANVGTSLGAPVYDKGNLSLENLTPGTVIHMTRQKGEKNFQYGDTHIGMVDADAQGQLVFQSFTKGKGWRAEPVDQNFINALPAQVVATNITGNNLERRAGVVAAGPKNVDLTKLTDEQVDRLAAGEPIETVMPSDILTENKQQDNFRTATGKLSPPVPQVAVAPVTVAPVTPPAKVDNQSWFDKITNYVKNALSPGTDPDVEKAKVQYLRQNPNATDDEVALAHSKIQEESDASQMSLQEAYSKSIRDFVSGIITPLRGVGKVVRNVEGVKQFRETFEGVRKDVGLDRSVGPGRYGTEGDGIGPDKQGFIDRQLSPADEKIYAREGLIRAPGRVLGALIPYVAAGKVAQLGGMALGPGSTFLEKLLFNTATFMPVDVASGYQEADLAGVDKALWHSPITAALFTIGGLPTGKVGGTVGVGLAGAGAAAAGGERDPAKWAEAFGTMSILHSIMGTKPERAREEVKQFVKDVDVDVDVLKNKLNDIRKQYEAEKATPAQRAPEPTPEEVQAGVEKLKQEYVAGEEAALLTPGDLSPEVVNALRKGDPLSPTQDMILQDKIKAALIGQRTAPESAAWEQHGFSPEAPGLLTPRTMASGAEPNVPGPNAPGMATRLAEAARAEAAVMAEQQAFMEQHKDVTAWYDKIAQEQGVDAANEAMRLHIAERSKAGLPTSEVVPNQLADRYIAAVKEQARAAGIADEGVTPMYSGGPDTTDWIKSLFKTGNASRVLKDMSPAEIEVASRISVGDHEKKTWATGTDIYTAIMDKYHPLRKFMEQYEQSSPGNIQDNIYKLARLFEGWHGKAEAFIQFHPWDRSTFQFNTAIKGLRDIIQPIDKAGRLPSFRNYVVSRRAVERDLKGFTTGYDVEAAKQVVSELSPEFGTAAKEYEAYSDSVLDYYRDSGMISAEKREQIRRESTDYAPLLCLMEPDVTGGTGGKGFQASEVVKKFKGSERVRVDPIESSIRLTYKMVNAAERNNVASSLIRWAKDSGAFGDSIHEINKHAIPIDVGLSEVLRNADVRKALKANGLTADDAVIFRPSAFSPGPNTISVWELGERKYYSVPKEVAEVVKGMDTQSTDALMKMLSVPAQALRLGATTLSPVFTVRNPFKDQFPAFIHSEYGYVPFVDFYRGIVTMAKGGEQYWKYMISGAPHSELISMDRRLLQDKLRDVLSGKLSMPGFLVRHPIEAAKLFAEYSERGTRIGEFNKGVVQEGNTAEGIQDAGFQSREVSIDFSRKGASAVAKFVNMTTAFWNPGLQGVNKVVRAHKDNPLRTMAKAAAAVTIPSLLLEWAFGDDPRYADLPQWRKDLCFNIPTKYGVVSLPKPWTYSILYGAIPQRLMRSVLKEDPHAFDGMFEAIGKELPDFPLPTAVTPFIENWANKKLLTGAPVVPGWKNDLPAKFRFSSNTPETLKQIGDMVSNIPIIGETNAASPAALNHIVQSWTGGAGKLFLDGLDFAMRKSGIVTMVPAPANRMANIPVLGTFFARYPSLDATPLQQFRNITAKSASKLRLLTLESQRLAMEGKTSEIQPLIEELGIDTALQLGAVSTMLNNSSKFAYLIERHKDMTPDQKRDTIDRIYLGMITTAKYVNTAVDKIMAADQTRRKGRGVVGRPAETNNSIMVSPNK